MTIAAKPGIGYSFERWGGTVAGKKNPLKITMNKQMKLSAHFRKNPKPLQCVSKRKPVKTSSIEKQSTAGKYAVDGDQGTRWSSKFSDPQSITIDLGRSYPSPVFA